MKIPFCEPLDKLTLINYIIGDRLSMLETPTWYPPKKNLAFRGAYEYI